MSMSNDQKNKPEQSPPIKFRNFWEIDDLQVTSSYRKLWSRIGSDAFAPAAPSVNWWKVATAAASVALLMVSGLYWYKHRYPAVQVAEKVYATGSPSQIILSDGTKVWLSAHTQLRYQDPFAGKNRDVELEGEAYFEVAHNASR